ncbi:hypothetical protein [Lysobacter gummosus]|uniref:hypothetical protein n=1 Tax=Lysobacter gummosus TaxID=262324 RepID=UPI00362CD92F
MGAVVGLISPCFRAGSGGGISPRVVFVERKRRNDSGPGTLRKSAAAALASAACPPHARRPLPRRSWTRWWPWPIAASNAGCACRSVPPTAWNGWRPSRRGAGSR